MMRALLLIAALLVVSCAPDDPGPPAGAPVSPRSGGPPNIVLIVADDLGAGHVSAFGGHTRTPYIDALARDGAMFTNAHTTATNCAPSRAGFLTGRMQNTFGFEYNPGGQRGDNAARGVPHDTPMLQELLKDAGYATGLVGKWHLGRSPDQRPNARGFDEFFGILEALTVYSIGKSPGDVQAKAPALRAFGRRTTAPVWRNDRTVHVKGYVTDAFSREATSFIARHVDTPFFLYVAYTAPHTPLEAPKRYLDRVTWTDEPRARTHDAMVLALDDGVGAIVQELKSRGLYDNTIIAFLSDNGCPMRPGAVPYCSNAPFGGSKNTFWEGGHRTPLILKGVGGPTAVARVVGLTSTLDLAPTFLAAAGVPTSAPLDGVDLAPALRDAAAHAPHASLTWRMGSNAAVHDGRWKLYLAARAGEDETSLRTPEDEGGAPDPLLAMRLMSGEQRKKALMPLYGVSAPDLGWHVMLYDLDADIGEQRNVADQHPEEVARLRAILDDWATTLPREPMWGPQSIRVYTTPDGVRVRMPG